MIETAETTTETADVFFPEGALLVGDALERLRDLPDACVDSIVTDPPYELSFMSRTWDSTGIAYNVTLWKECWRVLKPGGHLAAFGGARTYHRMAVAIEDAGFQIRDSIHWTYSNGFPKSLDVSKAIDRQRHDREDVYRVTAWVTQARDRAGLSNKDIDAAFGFTGMAGHWTSNKSQPHVPTLEQVPQLLAVLGVTLEDVPEDVARLLWELNGKKGQPGENWARREITGQHAAAAAAVTWRGNVNGEDVGPGRERRDVPATPEAAEWKGWGTALKPSHEPIVLARKPLIGTVADNVLTYGTGALNIDGTRVGTNGGTASIGLRPGATGKAVNAYRDGIGNQITVEVEGLGRWAANTLITPGGEACPAEDLDFQSGYSRSRGAGTRCSNRDVNGACLGHNNAGRSTSGETFHAPEVRGTRPSGFINVGSSNGLNTGGAVGPTYEDGGGASRFFPQLPWDPDLDAVAPVQYITKPGNSERHAGLDHLGSALVNEASPPGSPGSTNPRAGAGRGGAVKNNHPTVKPVAVMRFLQTLLTPPGGVTLDPFMGSGTSAVAAILDGFSWLGCELTPEYVPIIAGRVKHAQRKRANQTPSMFEGTDVLIQQPRQRQPVSVTPSMFDLGDDDEF